MRGSPVREWVTVPAIHSEHGGSLMEEAYAFVDEISPPTGDASTP
jgi:hypothetical protein